VSEFIVALADRRAVAGQLRGTLEQCYEADGLLCRIEIPLAPG